MKTFSILVATMLVASAAGAQDDGSKPKKAPGSVTLLAKPQTDAYAACFFSPEDVMAHQAEIKLQDDQRTKLSAEIGKAQAKLTDLQWQLTAEQEKLHKAVQPATVDEAATLKQVDRILAIEQELKRAQMTLMIRVKNTLTVEQQRQLHSRQSFAWNPHVVADSLFFARVRDRADSGKMVWLLPDSARRLVRF